MHRGIERIGIVQETVANRKAKFVFQRIEAAASRLDFRQAALDALQRLPRAERILAHDLYGDALPRRILRLDIDAREIIRDDQAASHAPYRVLLRLHLHGNGLRSHLASVDGINLHLVDIRVTESIECHRIGVVRCLDFAHDTGIEPVDSLDIEQIGIVGQRIGKFRLTRQILHFDAGYLSRRGGVVPHRLQFVFSATHGQDCKKQDSKKSSFHNVAVFSPVGYHPGFWTKLPFTFISLFGIGLK